MVYPLISIIIPIYNVEKYLDRCLKSVVNQTYANLEIILVDDGSTDNSPVICDLWVERDRRIRAFHIKNNGAANARNFGLLHANGDYIGFVDSDDYCELNLFETLLNNAVKNKADISICNYQINDETNYFRFSQEVIEKDYAIKHIAKGDYSYGVLWNKIYKREIVEAITMPDLHCSEDLVYNYYAFKNASKIVYTDNKLYHYFLNQNSVTNSGFNLKSLDAVEARRIILSSVVGSEYEEYAVWGLVLSCYAAINNILKSNQDLSYADSLRSEILSYKKIIFNSKLFSKKDRLKFLILSVSINLYKIFAERS